MFRIDSPIIAVWQVDPVVDPAALHKEKMMPNTLTETRCKAITQPGMYSDPQAPGLYFNVRASRSKAPEAKPSKAWVVRGVLDGRRFERGLGGFDRVRLADARRKAIDIARAIADGRDPFEEERVGRFAKTTFEQAARIVHETKCPKWRSQSHRDEWIGSLERHVFPAIGQKPLNKVSRLDVLDVLLRGKARLWSTRPSTARRIRQRIRQVLGWGCAHGLYTINFAGDVIDAALPDNLPPERSYRAMSYQEVGEALELVRESETPLSVKLAFELLVLTAVRSGEAREATWDEIDLRRKVWTIPVERMKSGREHRIPLSDAAIAVLERVKAQCPRIGNFVFGSERTGIAINSMAFTRMLRRTGLLGRATIHGFRSSFRTWASEQTTVDFATAELSLAHAVGGQIERIYSRSDLLEKRATLMQSWADYLTTPQTPAKVVRLHG